MSSTVAAFLLLAVGALAVLTVVLGRRLASTRSHLDALLAAQRKADQADSGDDAAAAMEAARYERAAAAEDRLLLAGALDAHGDGVIVVNSDGLVVLRNDAGKRYHGARHSDALAEEAIEDLLAAALVDEAGHRQLQLFGPPERTLRVSAHPIHQGNTIIGAAAVVRDVTEARRIDTIRRDFVAAVSHELKTPIGALSLLAETMNEAEDPAVVVQLADRIGREAERLGRIVDDLLDLSIVEAQESPRRDAVPVDLVLADAFEQVRTAAVTGGVPVDVGPPSPGLEIMCDRRQVTSAVRNLLENAVKYSEPGAPVELSTSYTDDTVTIVVRDHGIGIPRRDLERIFERFYRVDRARSRTTGGTGLGLSIVRHVAAAHGGDITVDSVEGEGSVFSLRLPCVQSAIRPATRLSEAS